MDILEVGGASDHVHLLVKIPATLSVAKAVQLLKANSSKWLRETFPEMKDFAWQEGYGAFSISLSNVEPVRRYIQGQEEHHRQRSFGEELQVILKKHGLPFTSTMQED